MAFQLACSGAASQAYSLYSLVTCTQAAQRANAFASCAGQCLPAWSAGQSVPSQHCSGARRSSTRHYSSETRTPKVQISPRILDVADLPPYIILLRHGESAGLENLQEELKIPNHRVPLSAHGVQQSFAAGQQVKQLLHVSQSQKAAQLDICHTNPSANVGNGKLFMYTSPFLRCIQTAQHISRALDEEQVRSWMMCIVDAAAVSQSAVVA
eukprot:GHUV01031345.1.p1 GENE.GHUV01031345.1~~GHUV01031345.1.p1  ORF type:complete len:211 (+),score=36.48 GHUV01031345.1:344-976(+)